MAANILDYDTIAQSMDRSWSMRLVARLQEGVEGEELDKIVSCLRRFDDYRVEGPLVSILEDSAAPLSLREAASRALREITTHATLRQRQKWHQSTDLLLQRHALLIAERKIAEEEQLILSIATDSTHPLHATAIERLAFDFPEERFQRIKIAALGSPSPQVRLAASRALESDGPVIAEAALLKAASDPDRAVAEAAINTLCWFASKNLLLTAHQMRCLAGFDGHPGKQLEYNRVFNYCLDVCLTVRPFDDAENRAVIEYFDSWLAPLWQILSPYKPPAETIDDTGTDDDWHPGDDDVNLAADAAPGDQADSIWDNLGDIWAPQNLSPQQKAAPAAPVAPKANKAKLLQELDNADIYRAPWQQTDFDWLAFNQAERQEILTFVLNHKDHLVRCVGVEACLVWQLEDEYIKLINDRALPVRRKACWLAKNMQPSRAIADNLFTILKYYDTTGSFALEVFDSWQTHAEGSADFEDTLLKLALHDTKEEVRARAASKLQIMQSKKVPFLESILLEPPGPTWKLHLTVLDDYFWARTRPSFIERILPIDSFEIQAMLAEIVTQNN